MCRWAGGEIEWKRQRMSTSGNAIRPYRKTRQERKKERERKATDGAPPLGFDPKVHFGLITSHCEFKYLT